jgi:undecaprenyl-diphosphatase
MSLFLACLLGFVQGVTEFFPISSSTHLRLCKQLCGISENDLFFDIICHLGTLGALLIYFRSDLRLLFANRGRECVLFFIALLPLVPGYFFFKPLRAAILLLPHLGWSLLATAAILYVGERVQYSQRVLPSHEAAITFKQQMRIALWIGIAQAFALIPGISRSAATISSARISGWSAQRATRFSFLLSIPAILGGCGMEWFKHMHAEAFCFYPWSYYVGCFCAAFISGICMIRIAVPLLQYTV